MLSLDNLHTLIGGIYDAAMDADQWSGFLEILGETFNAGPSMFLIQNLSSGEVPVMTGVRFDPGFIDSYVAYYASVNVWTQREEAAPAGTVVTDQMLATDEELVGSEFYNDWLAPQDTRHALGSVLIRNGNVISKLSILRSKRLGAFSDEEYRFWAQLIPHMQRAVQIYNQFSMLETYRDAAADALNRMPTGVVLVNAKAQVVFANHTAEDMIAVQDGFTIGPDRMCRAALHHETQILQRLIFSACATADGTGLHPGGTMTISRPTQVRVYQVLVTPLRSNGFDLGHARPAAAVFIADPNVQEEPPAERIANMLGLTPAESRVVAKLLSGSTVRETAERLELTEGTVRQYLKSVYQKTDTRGQTDLMRLVLSGIRIRNMD